MSTKLPDSKGRIARAKAKMPLACSVRRSQYCDDIIALRLQGHPFRKIEDWLRKKGLEFVIPAATLARNLMKGLGKEGDYLPVYEQEAEKVGGEIPLDPRRTLAGQAYIQRLRIDSMIRAENEKRRTRPGYANPRIRQEMETYLALVEAAAKYEEEFGKEKVDPSKGNSNLTSEAEEVIASLIINGGVTVPGTVVTPKKPNLSVVSNESSGT